MTPQQEKKLHEKMMIKADQFDELHPVGSALWYENEYRSIQKRAHFAHGAMVVQLSGLKDPVPINNFLKKALTPAALRALAQANHVAREFNRVRAMGTSVWYRDGYYTVKRPAYVHRGKPFVELTSIEKPVPVEDTRLSGPSRPGKTPRSKKDQVADDFDDVYELIDTLERGLAAQKADYQKLCELMETRHQGYEKSHTEYFTAITNFSDEHNKRCTNIEDSFGSLEEKVEQFIRKLEPSNRVEAQEHLLQLLLKVLEKLVED